MFLPLIITIFTAMTSVTTPERAQFEMMPLPYSYDALSPAISSETVEYHYGKHYRAYLDKLNELIADTPFEGLTLEQIIQDSEGPVFNNAAQVWNHEFYFSSLSPKAKHKPEGALLEAIDRWFGSFDNLKSEMTKACASLFGSGWVWLVEEESGRLSIISESNAGNPLRYGLKPLLGIDVWEHAYYLDYKNARVKSIEALWPLIDWSVVQERYTEK